MKRKKTNCETARDFSVEKALEKLGHFPKRTTEQEAWFLSPFRSETQASFKVSKAKNRWYDHGMGVGGNVIDLVSKILKCPIKETLEFLDAGIAKNTLMQQQTFNENEPGLDIIKVQEITHPALIQYLRFRGISIGISKTFCKEVWYMHKNTQFFAIGLKNHKNGWELRNKIFKNSSSPKSYTHIQNKHKQLIILEGMFDLLSLAMINESLFKASDIIVLNSIAFIKDMEGYINNYEKINLYLDNDASGIHATKYLLGKYNNSFDKSSTYKNYKDLNEFICYEKWKIS